jgi:hypothetical protein
MVYLYCICHAGFRREDDDDDDDDETTTDYEPGT